MEWISVKERLPEDAQIVLSFNQVCGVNPAIYNIGTGTNGFNVISWGNRIGLWYPYITHWMPLPEPPQRIEDGKQNT